MRTTRFVSWVFLFLGLLFFFGEGFRWALTPAVSVAWSAFRVRDTNWYWRAAAMDPDSLAQLAQQAESAGDAETLVLVALQPGRKIEGRNLSLADKAVALDPELTWVYAPLILRRIHTQPAEQASPADPFIEAGLGRLQQWDPGNAYPYLLEGEWLTYSRRLETRYNEAVVSEPSDWKPLAGETRWHQAMHNALEAPRYDRYENRLTELLLKTFARHRLRNPLLIQHWAAWNLYQVPQSTVLLYAQDLARPVDVYAEGNLGNSRPLRETLAGFHSLGDFILRVNWNSSGQTEKDLWSWAAEVAASRLPMLAQQLGPGPEIQRLEAVMETGRRWSRNAGEAETSLLSLRDSVLLPFYSAMVVVFGVLSLISVAYVNGTPWFPSLASGGLLRVVLILENYVTPLFFLFCLAFFWSYYPYWNVFSEGVRHLAEHSGFGGQVVAELYPNPFLTITPPEERGFLQVPLRIFFVFPLLAVLLAVGASVLFRVLARRRSRIDAQA